MMDLETIGGMALRHGATTAGGWLVAHGYLNSDGVTGFVGAVMILGGIALSWWNKRGQAAALRELKETVDFWEILRSKPTSPGTPKP